MRPDSGLMARFPANLWRQVRPAIGNTDSLCQYRHKLAVLPRYEGSTCRRRNSYTRPGRRFRSAFTLTPSVLATSRTFMFPGLRRIDWNSASTRSHWIAAAGRVVCEPPFARCEVHGREAGNEPVGPQAACTAATATQGQRCRWRSTWTGCARQPQPSGKARTGCRRPACPRDAGPHPRNLSAARRVPDGAQGRHRMNETIR